MAINAPPNAWLETLRQTHGYKRTTRTHRRFTYETFNYETHKNPFDHVFGRTNLVPLGMCQ